jgi:very-short-patch-repair endonuclease
MHNESPIAAITWMTVNTSGVLSGGEAVRRGVSRKQLQRLCQDGFLERVLPDTYRVVAVASTAEQRLRAALLWAGPRAAGWCRSAGMIYRLEEVVARSAEIVVPDSRGCRPPSGIVVRRSNDREALMIRQVRGFPVTGVEATLVALASRLDATQLEVACEDARRRRLTTVPAMRAYLDRHGRSGRSGSAALKQLLCDLDPEHPSRSKLEVLTRRLLAANGLGGFTRELRLEWNGRAYYFDFAYEPYRLIVETNGRRFHDDPNDYEYDQEKWSVPARYGYRIVFATWSKVNDAPQKLCGEIRAALAA